MTLCYLGLGSNLKRPEHQLRAAIARLHALPNTQVTQVSNIVTSRSWGVKSQPPYCNAVIEMKTHLPPFRLLSECQNIEQKQGRTRKKRWGARTLDIDILLYGSLSIAHPKLTIPHPRMHQRDFVLIPLLELAPNAHFPNGQPIHPYLRLCESHIKIQSL